MMSEKTIVKNDNHDKAMLSGNIHIAINLLYEPLRSFVSETLKMYSQTTPKASRKQVKLEILDFSQLLQYIRNNWSIQFAHCCSNNLLKVASVVIGIRNKISHQDFQLNCYQSYMKQLAKLASLINQPEIERKISSLFKISIVEADVHVCEEEKQWWEIKEEGNNFYMEERWTEAMNCYTRAIRLDSTQAVLFSNRALCELQLKQYQMGREDAEKAILLDPSKVKYYRILSEMLEHLNLYEESLEVCQKGLILEPRDDGLLMKQRNCAAFVAKAKTDNNPRFWLKEGATYKTLVKETWKMAPTLTNRVQQLTPKPEDILILSESAYLQKMKLTCKLQTAHKYLIDYKNDIVYERKAFEIFEAAANEDFAEGLYNVAQFYLHGKGGITRDVSKAEELLHKVAKQKAFLKFKNRLSPNLGVEGAENSLGNMFRDGNGRDKDEKKAFQWYLKSAEHGCPEGQNNLGYFLRFGIGCKQNLASARVWFERASENNIAEAQCNLAELLEAGEGGQKDVHKAYELFQAAANQGMPGALHQLQQLAQTFALGPSTTGATQNVLKQMSANSKDSDACFLMGVNYFNGEGGFEKEFGLSEIYLKKAVELGNKDAVLPLAELLFEVKRNEEAFTYLEQACELGKKEAYATFGKYCAFGHGCSRNVKKACKWLNRANAFVKNVKATDIKPLLNLGKKIVDWETSSNNNSSGFSLDERISRYLLANNKKVVGNDDRDISEISSKLISLFQSKSLTMDSSIKPNVCDWIEQMLDCAISGSKSAQNFFFATDKVEDAELLITSGFFTEGFKEIRLAGRLWDLLMFPQTIGEWANKALLLNPDNSEALFLIATLSNGSSLNEKIRLVSRCIEIAPSVADFHHLLGCFYGFAENYDDCLRELNRALELEFCPLWLYEKATTTRMSLRWKSSEYEEDAMKAIFAYERYLDQNHPDDRKVPEAYFSIGHIYSHLNDCVKAEAYWKKGIDAEKLRLPCFDQIDNDFPPRQMLQMFIAMEQKEIPAQNAVVKQCAYCNDDLAKYRCSSCKRAWYCSKQCQNKDWKRHKLACNKK